MTADVHSACISGADTGQVSVGTSSTLLANATIDVDPTSTYPRRKRIIICNTGSKTLFIGVGFVPTTTNYSYMLVPTKGTVDTSDWVAPGVVLEDASVVQDAIYAVTNSSTSTANVYVGV